MSNVIYLLTSRAYIFTCSYKTAWDNWLTDEEKQDYTFDEIMDYLDESYYC